MLKHADGDLPWAFGASQVRAPRVCANCVDHLLTPFALDHLVVYEMRLKEHSKALEYAHRGVIANIAPPDDPMQVEREEAKRHQGCGRLGCKPVSATIGTQAEADFTLTVCSAQPLQRDLADDLLSFRTDHGKAEQLPVIDKFRLIKPALQIRYRLGAAPRAPVEVSSHVGAAVDVEQVIQVVPRERTQDETIGSYRVVRPKHARILVDQGVPS
jgi:hypothetical protein